MSHTAWGSFKIIILYRQGLMWMILKQNLEGEKH